MERDATTLRKALDLLRQHYGERLPGPIERAEAQMRDALQQQMGMDAAAADNVLKQLIEAGSLVYVGPSAGVDTEASSPDRDTDEATTATGPVISMPLTQSADGGTPLITTASPAQIMGVVDYQGGDVPQSLKEVADAGTGAEPQPTPAGARGEVQADRDQGYWRIG